ncbi:Transmembrane protein 53-B [Cytospora mali]|uniref:Transmembrane protein 53-B n=1 Tax=Cytospora mali TaxID=578113 RepID=A0A194V609_CYTMA|nr:Transmembrane protein 53-B [Valsa mali var. pyri (nom. inval.)]
MAANVPTPDSSTKQGPLSSFTRISKVVYLYRPSNGRNLSASSGSSGSASTVKSPKLILLATWMDAREPHIAKYTTRYQALYPDSHIVLIRSFVYHFTTKVRLHPKEIEPAMPVIRSIISEAGGGGSGEDERGHDKVPDMLVHVFSNGGSTALRHVYGQYARSARPGEPTKLPAHATIFDSAPGRWQWGRTVTALMASLAGASWVIRLVMRPLVHLLCAFYWLGHVPWRRPGYLGQTWLVHNDRSENKSECRRTYIYSVEDELVDDRDIEEHAAAAAKIGYVPRLERFNGSQHVAHVRLDGERYWGIVRDTWENKNTDRQKLVP